MSRLNDDRLVSSRRNVLTTAGTTSALAGCANDGQDTTATTAEPTASASSRPAPSNPVGERIDVSTDDDLVAALDDASAGDHLVLDSGQHEVDEPLRKAADNMMLSGQGIRATTVVSTGDFPVVELIGTGPSGDRRRRWTFRDLNFNSGSEKATADILRGRHADGHRFVNVAFAAAQTTGNGIHAKACWDWKFDTCHFGKGGDPDRGTADVYAVNGDSQQTNNFHFLGCRWERIQSHAIYFDSSNDGGLNKKFRINTCKFHGQPGEHPPLYHIDGQYQSLQIANTKMGVANTGFIRGTTPEEERGQRNATLINNCLFHAWDQGPALDLSMNAAAVTGNVVSSGGAQSTAIAVDGAVTTVTGNLVYDGNVEVVAADGGIVSSNAISNPGDPGIVTRDGVDGVVVAANVVRNGDLDLAGQVEAGLNATV